MAVDVKSVAIKVSARGIKKAANDLSELSKAAKTFDVQSATAFKQLADFTKLSFEGVAQSLRDSREAIQGFKAITSKEAGKGLANSVSNMADAFDRLKERRADIDAFIAQIDRLKTGMAELAANGAVSIRLNTQQPRQQGTGAGSSEAEKYAKTQQRLLSQLEKEAVFVERGKAGWLEYRAAQLGVSEQAAPFIQRMKAIQGATNGVQTSTRAMNAVMRQVPAQFTDIATQLAGGQNPMLILLQQGGQLADSFRMVGVGMTGMLKAVGGMILKFLTNPLTLAIGALATLGFGAYKSRTEMDGFNKSLVVTGGYLGITKDQAVGLVGSLSGIGKSRSDVTEALTAIASTGKITGSNIAAITKATVEFSNATGTEMKKVADEYASLSSGPSKALRELDKQYHFLTASQYESVKVLERQGKATEALTLAQGLLSEAHSKMARDSVAQLGTIEKALKRVKDGAMGWYDTLMGLGKGDPLKVAYDDSLQSLDKLQKARDEYRSKFGKEAPTPKIDAQIAEAEARVQSAVKALNAREATKPGTPGQDRLKDARDYAETLSKTLQIQREVAKIDTSIAAIRSSKTKGKDDERLVADALKKRKELLDSLNDKAGGQLADRLAGLKAEKQAIESDIAGLIAYGAGYDKVSEKAKQLYAVENALSDPRTSAEKRKQLLQDKSLLLEIVPLEKERAKLLESAKDTQKWGEQAASARATTVALQEQAAEMLRTGETQSRMTATEKALVQAKQDLTKARGFDAVATAQGRILDLAALDTQEKVNKSIAETNKLRAEYQKISEQGSAVQQNMIAQYQFEASAIDMSNRERSKTQKLLQIDATLKRDIASYDAQIMLLKRGDSELNKTQIQELEKLIALRKEQSLTDAAVVSSNEGRRKQLEGSSITGDMKVAYDNFYDGLQTRQDLFQEAFSQSYSMMSNAISDFVTTGKMDFKSFTADVMKMIAQMITKMLILKAIQYATNSFGGASSAAVNTSGAALGSTGYGAGQFAKGGAFGGGTQMFAKGGTFTNSIVSRPTPFKFANGGGFSNGLMGEAGPEAIMPLTRGSDGKLGVQASGGGGNNISINVVVNNDGSAQTTTQGTDEQDGRRLGELIKQSVINIIHEQKRPGGVLAS